MARAGIFKIDSPSVRVDTTSADEDGTWLASGQVTFDLASGESLSFPFARAKNKAEAIRKAVEGLEQFLKRFERAASQTREDLA